MIEMPTQQGENDLERFSRNILNLANRTGREPAWRSRKARKGHGSAARVFPFASISVLVVLLTLFIMALVRGGWTWSSWTYALSFAILVPLVPLESRRKAVISGGGFIVLFLTVVTDAGMPGYFGYSASLPDWYDRAAHYMGAACITLFLWSIIWWTKSPSGPPKKGGQRVLLTTIVAMVALSTLFKATEYMGDFLYGLTNTHGYVDTAGDLMFNLAGIAAASIVIKRHNYSVLKRPFWYSE